MYLLYTNANQRIPSAQILPKTSDSSSCHLDVFFLEVSRHYIYSISPKLSPWYPPLNLLFPQTSPFHKWQHHLPICLCYKKKSQTKFFISLSSFPNASQVCFTLSLPSSQSQSTVSISISSAVIVIIQATVIPHYYNSLKTGFSTFSFFSYALVIHSQNHHQSKSDQLLLCLNHPVAYLKYNQKLFTAAFKLQQTLSSGTPFLFYF